MLKAALRCFIDNGNIKNELDHQIIEKSASNWRGLSKFARNLQIHFENLGFSLAIYLDIQEANMIFYASSICMQTCMSVHACLCRRVREVVRVCMPFPVCLCFRDESPSKSQRLSPSYLSHWWMVEVWDRGLVEDGSKDGESEWWREGEREAHARQFPWRWVIHRHRKCLTSHPEKCPQRNTCVKGVIEHN